MKYVLTGKLIEHYRLKQSMPKARLASMIGIEYRGLIDKIESGDRKAPAEVAQKLFKFLNLPVEEYITTLVADYENSLREELKLSDKNIIVAEEETWKNLI